MHQERGDSQSTLDEQLRRILNPLGVEVEIPPSPACDWLERSPPSEPQGNIAPDLILHCLLVFCGAALLSDVSSFLQVAMSEERFTQLSTNQGYTGPEQSGYLILVADEAFPKTLLTRLKESRMITQASVGVIHIFE